MKKTYLWLAVFLSPLLFSAELCTDAQAKTEKTLILRQASDTLGTITTYINKSAVKILIPDPDCYFISKAPTWKVVLYNARNKVGFEMPFSQWMKHSPRFMPSSFDDRFNYLILEKEKLTWLGMPARKFVFPCSRVNGVLQHPSSALQGEYITVVSPLVNEKTGVILQKTLAVPQGPGIPVYLLTKAPELKRHVNLSWRTGGDTQLLRTLRTEQKDVPDSFFTYPKDYKQVDLEVDVLMNQSKKDAIEEMVKGMSHY
jgi:hypothetical protein